MRLFRRKWREYAGFRRVFDATPGRHKEPSIVVSLDDELALPTKRLLNMALGAATRARDVEFRILARRTSVEPRWHEVWPGGALQAAGRIGRRVGRSQRRRDRHFHRHGNPRDRRGAAGGRLGHDVRHHALAGISKDLARGGRFLQWQDHSGDRGHRAARRDRALSRVVSGGRSHLHRRAEGRRDGKKIHRGPRLLPARAKSARHVRRHSGARDDRNLASSEPAEVGISRLSAIGAARVSSTGTGRRVLDPCAKDCSPQRGSGRSVRVGGRPGEKS